jgi:MAGUK p55 subfamily protein 5
MKFIESLKLKLDLNQHKLEDEDNSSTSSSSSSSSTSISTSNQFNETTNELCQLLSKFEIQSLLIAHDQLATRYQEQTIEQQKQNKAFMIEQEEQRRQQKYISESPTNIDYVNHIGLDTLDSRYQNSATQLISSSSTFINHNEQIIEQQEINADDSSQFLSDEGRYLLSKAQHYAVDNLKLVNIEKPDAPLGATIRNRDGSIVIGRIVVGGAAEQSGLLHEDDEILEINNIPVRGKTINDVCDMLCDLQGIVSFLIIPNMNYEPSKLEMEQNLNKSPKIVHLRALFNYVPQEDLYIPCKELGLAFSKGDILHIISQEDEDWWQAYKDDEKDQSLAGLIPAPMFQERRCSQMQALIGDSFMTRKKRDKGFCIRGMHKNKRRRVFDGINEHFGEEIVTYEEVTLYSPVYNRKRPIVLIGPHSIGRHELRKRLMQSNPSLFEVAVPHTTRPPRKDEIDGKDYHFLPRHIFEADIKQSRFIEHGEYEKNLYGTSRESIKKVIENSKICVLNLYPQALKTLRNSDLMPYVIYIGPPNLAKLKELKNKLNENYRENDLLDIIDKGREIEELYGHYFDKIIRNSDMDKTYQELFETINRVQNEENWVPTSWLNR